MSTESKKAWWRELGAISQGMLFIDGNIAIPQAAEPAKDAVPAMPNAAAPGQRSQRARQDGYAKRLREMTALSLFR